MTTAIHRETAPSITLPTPSTIRQAATDTLDRMEAFLPALPSASLRLQRALARRTGEVATDTFTTVRRSVESSVGATATAARTVAGTTRWATEQAARSARTAVRTVWGQTRAQVDIATDAIADERDDLQDELSAAADDAARVVSAVAAQVEPDGSSGPIYESWTKQRLYDEAQTLDIDGRSTMTKSELIDALRRS